MGVSTSWLPTADMVVIEIEMVGVALVKFVRGYGWSVKYVFQRKNEYDGVSRTDWGSRQVTVR